MGDHSAFFYGTLMAPPVLHRVIHGTPNPPLYQKHLITIKPAILHSFCRHKVRHCDYPAIIPSSASTPSSATVRGTFVQGLTDGDLWRLDIFEGDEYERRKVKVRVLEKVGDEAGKGNIESEAEVEAETYVWVAGGEGLEEGEWDFGEFQREKMGRWVGGTTEEYDEVDEAVRARGGDPTGGRGLNGSITGELEKAKEMEMEKEVLESAV